MLAYLRQQVFNMPLTLSLIGLHPAKATAPRITAT
jgi:hypothetical protein